MFVISTNKNTLYLVQIGIKIAATVLEFTFEHAKIDRKIRVYFRQEILSFSCFKDSNLISPVKMKLDMRIIF